MNDDISKEDRDWLVGRAELTRERWRDAEHVIRQVSHIVRPQLEILRAIDKDLPFGFLTTLLEAELT